MGGGALNFSAPLVNNLPCANAKHSSGSPLLKAEAEGVEGVLALRGFTGVGVGGGVVLGGRSTPPPDGSPRPLPPPAPSPALVLLVSVGTAPSHHLGLLQLTRSSSALLRCR